MEANKGLLLTFLLWILLVISLRTENQRIPAALCRFWGRLLIGRHLYLQMGGIVFFGSPEGTRCWQLGQNPSNSQQ